MNNSSVTVRSSTSTETETAVTFVNNELMRAFITMGEAAGADTSFIRHNRELLTEMFRLGLEQQLIDEIRVEFTTVVGQILETWVFDVSYDGDEALVELPVDEVCDEVSNLEEQSLFAVQLLVRPVFNNVPLFMQNNEQLESITSFGGGGIDVDVGRKK